MGLLLIAVTLLTACGAGATPTPALLSSASPVPATAPTASPTRPPRSTATATPPALILESLAQIGGTSRAATLQGRYAYLNVGPRLVILDIADPARPVLAGQSAPLPAFESLAVAGAHAYVAAGTAACASSATRHEDRQQARQQTRQPRQQAGRGIPRRLAPPHPG